MFLVLFGGVFSDQTQSRVDLVQVGDVAAVRRAARGRARGVRRDLRGHEVRRPRRGHRRRYATGDADVAVEMQDGDAGRPLHADRPGEGRDHAGHAARVRRRRQRRRDRHARRRTRLATERVEDDSLTTIQFVTPGLLGWAVAMSAAFGAAATLQGWRQSKLLRRLQLAPVSTPHRGRRPGRGHDRRSRWCRWRSSSGSARPRSGCTLTGAWSAAVPLLVVGTLCFMSVGLLAGAVAQHDRGRGQHGQLHRAADGVPERLVLPARRRARLDAGRSPAAAAAPPQRRACST